MICYFIVNQRLVDSLIVQYITNHFEHFHSAEITLYAHVSTAGKCGLNQMWLMLITVVRFLFLNA